MILQEEKNVALAPAPIERVLAGGYCIGCGACAAVTNSPATMALDEFGRFQAQIDLSLDADAPISNVCPFVSDNANETAIGKRLYDGMPHDRHIGFYAGCYAGHVAETDFRSLGSSGGVGKWILHELLQRNMVDAVIQVTARDPDETDPSVYAYSVTTSLEAAKNGSKSVYYPVEMSEVLAYVREHPGRYAITGIPCFVKAIRLLANQEPVFKQRIRFCIGLICGHLKSARYADMLAWQFGVEPGQLGAIDFRKKIPGARANQKGIEVRGRRGAPAAKKPDIVQHLFGTNYNHGFFQYRACDFCDDVVGETADVSVGDAWLPEYMADGAGTSVLVVRHPDILRIIEDAIETGRLNLERISPKKVADSQKGGFRQRREGLAYRMYLANREDVWHPEKREKARAYHIGPKRKKIYRLRKAMSERSHLAFRDACQAGDFALFENAMKDLLSAYETLYEPTLAHRIKHGLLRRLRRVGKKLRLIEDDRG